MRGKSEVIRKTTKRIKSFPHDKKAVANIKKRRDFSSFGLALIYHWLSHSMCPKLLRDKKKLFCSLNNCLLSQPTLTLLFSRSPGKLPLVRNICVKIFSHRTVFLEKIFLRFMKLSLFAWGQRLGSSYESLNTHKLKKITICFRFSVRFVAKEKTLSVCCRDLQDLPCLMKSGIFSWFMTARVCALFDVRFIRQVPFFCFSNWFQFDLLFIRLRKQLNSFSTAGQLWAAFIYFSKKFHNDSGKIKIKLFFIHCARGLSSKFFMRYFFASHVPLNVMQLG